MSKKKFHLTFTFMVQTSGVILSKWLINNVKRQRLSLCCLIRDTAEVYCPVPLPLWHKPFNLDFYHTKRYFHQMVQYPGGLHVCCNQSPSASQQGPFPRQHTEMKHWAATLNPIEKLIQFEHHIGYSQILDGCFILQKNQMGHRDNMTSAIKFRKAQVNIVVVFWNYHDVCGGGRFSGF